MQQFYRVCMIADHDQEQIEYICIFPGCNLGRFACSKCVKMGNHKHQQQDQSHVQELYQYIYQLLFKRQKQQGVNFQKGDNLLTQQLKQKIEQIQNSLKQITNMIEQLEQNMEYNHSDQQLKELLLKLKFYGFNQFDDVSLNILINIHDNIVQPFFDIYTQLFNQSNSIAINALEIQDWSEYQIKDYGEEQKLKYSKCKLITQDQCQLITQNYFEDNQQQQFIYTSAISNDFKFIVSGGTKKKLKIWNYRNNKLIKSIKLDDIISKIKFTDDSRLLYVGKRQDLYQFDVNKNFKVTYKERIHLDRIQNIFCITNTIILTASSDKTIIKTDVSLKQQLLLIKAHDCIIDGLDYNHNLEMIATSSGDKSIKIWNGNDGQLVLEKQNAHNVTAYYAHQYNSIQQVLFRIKGDQLISLDDKSTILVWMINYESKQLEQQKEISYGSDIYNISLVLNQQYIIFIRRKYIGIYSIKGDLIKELNHNVYDFQLHNTIQPQSMKAIIIQGTRFLKIFKVKIDLEYE